MLLALLASSIQAWSYRITDNYTIETKFKINAIGAGIAFAGYQGFGSSICMWQFNVGIDGTKSLFRPHDWKVGGILLSEINTADKGVPLNTTDWFVATIEVSNNGGHADTYLRRADDDVDVLIDSRDGNFRFGLVGTRQDHDGSTNESATYDYFKVSANETGDVLYYEDFNATNGNWSNDPIWDSAAGTLTTEGRELSERKYFPNNMFLDAIDMHYTVEADVTIVNGYVSFIFGLDETNGGSNYMWQISPNYYNDTSVNIYYHLDNGNESWKAHAAGPRFPDLEAIDVWDTKRHVMIEVKGNVVKTYIDGQLEDTFTQCDMTDLALLNKGKMGIRVDAANGVNHEVYVDNVKLTEFDAHGNATVVMEDGFDGGVPHYFDLSGKNATYAKVEEVNGDYALHITCDGTTDKSAKVRLIQTDDVLCSHDYANGICTICGAYEEPGYDTEYSAYTIANLGQLIRFSEIVNAGETNANGKLLCDIDMGYSDKFQPIGLNNDASWQRPFSGTFYGENHVVRNLYVKTECEGGLFSRLRGGKIYNLGLENAYIESTANLRCGAIVGEHHGGAQMANCFARGDIQFVTKHAQKDAIAGESAGGYYQNCYTTLPQITCSFPGGGEATNCYAAVTTEQGASGEITYKLGNTFRQTIGEDAYPELDQTHGIVQPMTAAGYATFYNDATAVVLSDNVTVYTGAEGADVISLTEQQNTIPAQTAVVLRGAEGYYSYTPTASAPAISGTNDLLGTAAPLVATGSEYALGQVDGVVGFYKVTPDTTIPAGKAYVKSTSGVKGFVFVEEDATAINEVINPDGMKNIRSAYDLSGRKLSHMKHGRGIVIVNGKKVLN